MCVLIITRSSLYYFAKFRNQEDVYFHKEKIRMQMHAWNSLS